MNPNRKLLAAVVAVAALAAGGIGVAYGTGGGENEAPLTGSEAERAEAAALQAAGGGTVLESEANDDGGGGYEVEVKREDGSVVEFALDDRFQPVGREAEDGDRDEDEGAEDEAGETDD
jgi:hypothetical protein